VSWEAFNLLVEKLLPFAQARRSELKSPEVRGAFFLGAVIEKWWIPMDSPVLHILILNKS
jgi:hypothetical protein